MLFMLQHAGDARTHKAVRDPGTLKREQRTEKHIVHIGLY